MPIAQISIRPVTSKADRKAFIDLPFRLYADDPNWVPPLRSEVAGLLDKTSNPWFEHGEAQLFIAEQSGRITGRISAHIDRIALTQPSEQGFGPGTGFFGFYEAEDEASGTALLRAAEDWLRGKGMTRMLGPISFAMWDETGLLVETDGRPATAMMAYNNTGYAAWIEAAGLAGVQDLYTYNLPIADGFTDLSNRVVAMGEKTGRIVVRNVSKARFDEEAALIMSILNDAWSDNWGFVPFTDTEIAYAGKKLRPIVFEDLIRIAEIDGEPVAFMMTIPDLNEKLIGFGGTLLPFNWAKLLWWLRAPKVTTMRVPLMGVVKRLQGSRMASQIAFMMIEYLRRTAVEKYGATRGDFGWVLASNGPMRSVGEAIGGSVNKIYRIYGRDL